MKKHEKHERHISKRKGVQARPDFGEKSDNEKKFLTNRKGRDNEERFHHLFSNPAITPSWIIKVVKTGREDDWRNGIDFFVHTSTGWKIPVDVKSSFVGRHDHFMKRGSEDVCVIVMMDDYSDDEMRECILDLLATWQEKAIARGITPNTAGT